jgi:hypothetical protein
MLLCSTAAMLYSSVTKTGRYAGSRYGEAAQRFCLVLPLSRSFAHAVASGLLGCRSSEAAEESLPRLNRQSSKLGRLHLFGDFNPQHLQGFAQGSAHDAHQVKEA